MVYTLNLLFSQVRSFTLTLLYLTTPPLYICRNHFSVYRITGDSMSPSLSPDFHNTGKKDWMLFQKNLRLADEQGYGVDTVLKSQLKRGMVVMFWTPHSPDRIAVKRVVALEGDVVVPLAHKKIKGGQRRVGDGAGVGGDVTVPFGHVWVEGDNSDVTLDSNDYGPISKSLITGVAKRIVWPWERRGKLTGGEEWRERCNGRIRWNGNEGIIPAEWTMY